MMKQNPRLAWSTAFAARLPTLGAASLVALAGCWDPQPCDPGEIVMFNECYQPPPDAGSAASDAGKDGGGQPAPDMYSYKTCATDADCGGQTPSCTKTPPPPATMPYCTSSPCETGPADTCPLGGACTDEFKPFGAPNFCAKD